MDCLKFTEDSFLIAFLLMMKIAYRTLYQLIENHVVLIMCYGTVLMGLSKAFYCIPLDLLIAKLHAYGLSEDAVIINFKQ